jgi:hypothetical protein
LFRWREADTVLTAEEAATRLATLQDPEWRIQTSRRIKALPRLLREPAEAFAAPEPAPLVRKDAEQLRNRRLEAARILDRLTSEDRALVFAALHPGLGLALARWWTDAKCRPYLHGWDRKAFRVLGAPEVTRADRAASLARLVSLAGPFDCDPVWLAIWGGHLAAGNRRWPMAPRTIGGLLASAIDLGGQAGEETLRALIEVGNGEHPAGMMGRHVIIALLGSGRPEGWEFVERLLLAAQRQEGLRQSILEAADEGHPAAFDRMLAVVLGNRLLRFAAAVRAAGVWLGFGASVGNLPLAEERVRKLALFRSSPRDRVAALSAADPWDAYIALCAHGMRDAVATMAEMRTVAGAASPALRAAALRYACATGLTVGQQVIAHAVDDEDVGVASLAASLLATAGLELPGTFDALARLISRQPATPREETGLGVELLPVTRSRAETAGLLIRALGSRSVADLLPWLPVMNPRGRAGVANLLTGNAYWLPEVIKKHGLTADFRPAVISLLSDRSPLVRGVVIKALTKTSLPPSEAGAVEALLARAATDVRRGALTMLASLPPDAVQASAARLAASKDKRQRDAAVELFREIGGKPRDGAAGDPGLVQPPIEDLHDTLTAGRTRPAQPQHPKRRCKPDGRAANVLAALGEIAARHRNVPVTISSWQGSREMLFGDVKHFPSPFGNAIQTARVWPGQGAAASMPGGSPARSGEMVLGEAFREYWTGRPAGLRGDDDGLDALRAYALAAIAGAPRPTSPILGMFAGPGGDWWHVGLRQLAGTPPKAVPHLDAVRHVTIWLAAEYANGMVIDECLDALETTLATVPRDVLTTVPATHPRIVVTAPGQVPHADWRNRLTGHPWHGLLTGLLQTRPGLFTPAQITRWYRLMRWVERPVPQAKTHPVIDRLLVAAHGAGAASGDDVAAAFLQPRNLLFQDLTRHWRGKLEAAHPALAAIADRVRDRVVEVELRRGDLPTPTSLAAINIASICGVRLAAGLLRTLGKTPLTRGWRWSSDSRADVLSHLVRVSFPGPGETGTDLKAAADEAGVAPERLVDLALYAPQWAVPVEEALGWPGLADGVLWLHAHTKDRQWSVDAELRGSWAAMTAERTPLASQDLIDGAVDVAWFGRAHAALGPERWAVLHKAARYASGGTGHRRAQLYAKAMLSQHSPAEMTSRITARRDQEAVRALGLLPLPRDPARRRADTQRRYAVLREFERGRKAFGSMRQASERTAVRIGVENLARTAGYPDPLRFTWAVEAQQAGDLADGPVAVAKGDVTLTLSVDTNGTPALAIARGGRALKSVPAALRKDPDVAELQARKTELAKQATRVRAALEAAMVTQDAITATDFADLRRHPVVAPMLSQLAWVTQDGQTVTLDEGQPGGPLRIAHPVDFVADGSWVSWQERMFAAGRRQPFKQAFRELYVLTKEESKAGPLSHRYDGHQLQHRQALALLGTRGWLTSRETSEAVRVFHRHDLVARVTFANGFLTPAEADLPTIDGISFTRRGEYLAQPLDSVPRVVFSEAMRDLDLVVSVAHAGGVDPEATASTTEMRAALIRETARLLKLGNIEFVGQHVLITGRLGEYSLHLGSGTTHRRPGGAVCIIPVGSQHRGRLFLPFADDDPKTAEIVSKTLLLARDHEIKDSSILEQLRS